MVGFIYYSTRLTSRTGNKGIENKTTFDPGLPLAALLALFAIVPLLAHPGLPNTADGPVHLMRQFYQFRTISQSNHPPKRN